MIARQTVKAAFTRIQQGDTMRKRKGYLTFAGKHYGFDTVTAATLVQPRKN